MKNFTPPTPDAGDREEPGFRLYVAGNSPNSLRAVANLKRLCGKSFKNNCHIEIVDVLEHPLKALGDDVIVCPTLIRLSPPPVVRVIGDLSDTDAVESLFTGRREVENNA
ncbi:MAG: circadian clock KaiB family protein [Desulfatibacillaceae bacterium]